MVNVSNIKFGNPPDSGAVKDNLHRQEEIPVISDGRSLRTTGRTAQLSTRVKPETLQMLRQLTERDRITMTEVIERALEMYASK